MFKSKDRKRMILMRNFVLVLNVLGVCLLYCNESLATQPIPDTDPPSGSTGGGTRGDCLVIPLIPQGGNHTMSENPDVWVYVGLSKDSNSAPEYQISVEHRNSTISSPIRERQLIKKEEFPRLIKFNLPVQNKIETSYNSNQVLPLNQKYGITFRCQVSGSRKKGIGNSLSIERKLIDKNVVSLPLKKMFEFFQSSNLGIDATSLLFSKNSCSNPNSANELFESMVSKQILVDKSSQSKFVLESLSEYNRYLPKMCQNN